MAIDYIIGGLMLSSAAVNVLALGAFWISPGLRTTANRFVINLLVVNVVACIALVPVFWQEGRFGGKSHISYDNEGDFDLFASAASNARLVIDEPQFNLNVEPLHPRYGHHLPHSHHIDAAAIEEKIVEKEITRDKLLESIQSIQSAIIERETGVVRTHKTDGTHCDCHRFWGFDLAATLGKHQHNINLLIHILLGRRTQSACFHSVSVSKTGQKRQIGRRTFFRYAIFSQSSPRLQW